LCLGNPVKYTIHAPQHAFQDPRASHQRAFSHRANNKAHDFGVYSNMSNDEKISELGALQIFADKCEAITKELEAYPPGHIDKVLALYKEVGQSQDEFSFNQECTLMVWHREREGEKPLPGDSKLLKKLKKDIPEADEIIRKMNHGMLLQIILKSSREGWSVTDLCNLLDSEEADDPEFFSRELDRIVANRKLPN